MNNNQTVQQASDIRDIKGLEHFTYSPFFYIIPALILAALLYAAWRLYQKRRGKIKAETIPPPPPDETALRELDLLRRNGQFEKLGEKLFNFCLSEVFRNYLEARYDFPASDMTTEEINSFLPKKVEPDPDHSGAIKKILTETDRVKFAKFRPGKNIAYGLVDEAVKFVEQTRTTNEETIAAQRPISPRTNKQKQMTNDDQTTDNERQMTNKGGEK